MAFVRLNADFDGVAEGQGQLLLLRLGGFVGSHDVMDEGVADYIALLEVAEVDALDAVEDVDGVEQAGFARVGQVDLGDVAGDDRLGAVAAVRRGVARERYPRAGCLVGRRACGRQVATVTPGTGLTSSPGSPL